MRLKSARIKNFRCVRDAAISFDRMTVLVGGNGSGKSTILRAIDLFYAGSPGVTLHDFYNRDASNPIEIDLTFFDFTEDERAMFASKIDNNEMSVARVFELEEGRTTGRYYGTSLQNPEFAAIRAAAGVEKRNLYNRVRNDNPHYELPAVTRIDQVEPALSGWEGRHPERSVRARDDGQFFGFKNIANGKLQKATSFVFIPAVRDAALDAADSRGAATARLMELVVRSAIERRVEVQQFRTRISEEYRNLMNPANLPELGNLATALSTTLRRFYSDAAVDLQWQAMEDIDAPPPNAQVSLEEDDFRVPVERTGHGLQRAFILSLLQHLALALSFEEEAVDQNDNAGIDVGDADERQHVAPAGPRLLPGLILAIEEPELYQHPTKQRHFARVLSHLAAGALPGVARQMQVVFATHSPLFVRMEEFRSIRLAKRIVGVAEQPKETVVCGSTIASVCEELAVAYAAARGDFTEASLLARLHIMNPEICEGFFANATVLVEGPSDKAALIAAAVIEGTDLEASGVAVVPCGNVNNLDRPALIFRQLGIPIYVVWDGDRGTKAGQVTRNRALQRLMKIPENGIADSPEFVGVDCACFKDELETTMSEEIGKDLFDRILTEQKIRFGLEDRDEALKVPACVTAVLTAAAEQGRTSATLRSIIQAVIRKSR